MISEIMLRLKQLFLHIDNEENTIMHNDEAEQFECVLIKSGTEETEIDIYADADFIELEKDSLSTDDFAGDRAVIKYIVNPTENACRQQLWIYTYSKLYAAFKDKCECYM